VVLHLIFRSNKVEFFCDSNLVSSSILTNGLYLLSFGFVSFVQCQSNICSVVGSKRGRAIETSSMLWHKRLGHIYKERMKRLINEIFFIIWTSLISTRVLIVLRGSSLQRLKRPVFL